MHVSFEKYDKIHVKKVTEWIPAAFRGDLSLSLSLSTSLSLYLSLSLSLSLLLSAFPRRLYNNLSKNMHISREK